LLLHKWTSRGIGQRAHSLVICYVSIEPVWDVSGALEFSLRQQERCIDGLQLQDFSREFPGSRQ
jgi:hypothetical protein